MTLRYHIGLYRRDITIIDEREQNLMARV